MDQSRGSLLEIQSMGSTPGMKSSTLDNSQIMEISESENRGYVYVFSHLGWIHVLWSLKLK